MTVYSFLTPDGVKNVEHKSWGWDRDISMHMDAYPWHQGHAVLNGYGLPCGSQTWHLSVGKITTEWHGEELETAKALLADGAELPEWYAALPKYEQQSLPYPLNQGRFFDHSIRVS
jgi:hypothetical protein